MSLSSTKAILILFTKYMIITLRNQVIGYFEHFIPFVYDLDV